jgi:hypothetical protein
MMKPFIVYESDNQYGKIPDNYIDCLNRWKDEKERYEGEQKALAGQAPGSTVDNEPTSNVAAGDPVNLVLSSSSPSSLPSLTLSI